MISYILYVFHLIVYFYISFCERGYCSAEYILSAGVQTKPPWDKISALIFDIVPSSHFKSLVRGKMAICYKQVRQQFRILDHLLHVVHFSKMKINFSV